METQLKILPSSARSGLNSILVTIAVVASVIPHKSVVAKAGQDQTAIRPFEIPVVSQNALDDLRLRIAATRWPEKETVADDSQGVRFGMNRRKGLWGISSAGGSVIRGAFFDQVREADAGPRSRIATPNGHCRIRQL